MKSLMSIVASAGLVLALAASPAEAQRKASGRDDGGGSEPTRASGSKSGSESQPRAEPSPRVIREPASRVPRQAAPSQPRSRVIAASAGTSSDARRGAVERTGQRFAVARPAGSLDPRPIRVIWTTSHFPAFVGYSPWGYDPWGYRRFSRYGYSPYAYGYWPGYYGFAYGAPMYGGGYAGGYDYEEGADREPQQAAGSIRFRVEPTHAAIYVDGALAGIVDTFDGLTNHLRLPAGTHAYELRAEGYRPYLGTLTVVAGQTRTERVTLERLAPAQ